MDKSTLKFETVDEYIAAAPPKARKLLREMRKTIKQAAPEAEELISYNMPAFKLHGMLVYYAAWKEHIGLYPASDIKTFDQELKPYERSKGTIRFPMNEPLPLDLISRIVKFRVQQNLEKAKLKKRKR